MDLKKKLLYKMLVKDYLSDNIKAPFEDFALNLRNAWATPTKENNFLLPFSSLTPVVTKQSPRVDI